MTKAKSNRDLILKHCYYCEHTGIFTHIFCVAWLNLPTPPPPPPAPLLTQLWIKFNNLCGILFLRKKDVAAFQATLYLWYIFFLKAQMARNFEFLIGNVYWLFKKMQTSAFLRPLPPHVCKRLQLGTPSPPKNCGRPLWTAPKLDPCLCLSLFKFWA